MADKIARTHTHKSNRASTKDSDNNERRTVFKSVLDNPYKIPWPSVPVNIQNLALAKVMIMLDGVGIYNTAKSDENRKRKRQAKSKSNSIVKRQKLDMGDSLVPDSEEQPTTITPPDTQSQSPLEQTLRHLVPPPMMLHVTIGINEVTKRLETQAQRARSVIRASDNVEADVEAVAPIRVVFVCRDDVNPLILINHLPHLVAAVNSIPGSPEVKLVPLPKGSESTVAGAIGVKRAAVIAFDDSTPGILALMPLLEPVPVIVAPWLTPAAQSVPAIPTHIKQVRTSVPKDIKKHKEKRFQEKKEAKERRSKSMTTRRAKTREVVRAIVKST